MSRPTYTAFQRHLLFFSTPTQPPRLTFLSALRAATKLGLDMPVAVILSLSLRIMYAPFPNLFSAITIEQIPRNKHRTQLENVSLPSSTSKVEEQYTCKDLLGMLDSDSSTTKMRFVEKQMNRGHVVGFWAMAANSHSNRVSRDDVERFQQGGWEDEVTKRRKDRSDILPLRRGGPMWVTGHSWAVGKLLGVRVYKAKEQ